MILSKHIHPYWGRSFLKVLILTILLSGLSIGVKAQSISEDAALANVTSFLGSHMGKSGKSLKKIHPTLTHHSPGIYAFDCGDCFVLASDDARRPPILGYSDGGSFEEAYKSDCFRALIKQYGQDYNPDFRIFKPTDVASSVAPLCKDNWHQYEPFNWMCPEIEGVRSITGCVANSMAELMNYYKYPIQGTGYLEHNDLTGSKQLLTSDLSDHTYEWAKILDEYGEAGSYSESSGKAVAQLLYDCGLAVNMSYGVESSSARIIYQPISLVNHFGYDEGMQMYYRNFFTQMEWDSIMFHEIDAGRPMLVGGWTDDGGHSYVCDGYDENGFFHLRMGWPNSVGTGYYYFTWTTPQLPEWYDINSPERGFNVLQAILVGAKPKTSPTPSTQRYIYALSHIRPLSDDTLTVSNTSQVDIGVYALCNCGWNEHHGKVGIAMKRLEEGRSSLISQTRLLYEYPHEFLLEEVEDTTYSDTIRINLSGTKDGRYKLVPVYEENGSFIEARTMVGTPNYIACDIKNGVAKLYEPLSEGARLRLIDVDFPELVSRWEPSEFSYTVTNDGKEYSGRIFMSLWHENLPMKEDIFSIQGVSIGEGETQHYTFKTTKLHNIPVGTLYHLRISYDIDLLTDSVIVLYDDAERYISVQNFLTSIEETSASTGHLGKSHYYDQSGRSIPSSGKIPKGSIYIEVLPSGERVKRIKK